jgi:alanyl-tRNA synthetase
MTLPTTDTAVTYPDGATSSTGTVVHVEPLADGRSAVLLDVTACHPVDSAWPDQPADRGTLTTQQGTRPLLDAVTGGIHDGVLHLGDALPVRTGTEGWTFVVAHVVEGPPPPVGDQAQVDVDPDHRAALSAAWTKPAPTDALGNPAFDALAIQRSRIHPHGSTDTYRIGKSLRRKGFTPAALEDLPAVAERVDAQLAEWIAVGGAVRVERSDDALSARRRWVCALPAGVTDIPCGGTHIRDIGELSHVTTSLTARPVDGGVELVMETVTVAG